MSSESTASDDRLELARTVRSFLASNAPLASLRSRMMTDHGWDTAVWRQMTEQLCLTQLALPEDLGGIGASFAEVGSVLQEQGRILSDLPFLGTVVAISTLLDSGTALGAELAASIALKGSVATVAFAEAVRAWQPLRPETVATHANGGYRVTGVKSYVFDGWNADWFVVSAMADGVPRLFAIKSQEAVQLEPTRALDPTRPLSRLHLNRAVAMLVSPADGDGDAVAHAVDLVQAALASESAGGSRRVLEATVEYLKLREQFGRKIGSFQALKHRCADMAIDVEACDATAEHAAAAHSAGDLSIMAPLAKLYCTSVYCSTTAEMIQLHGGIGFTWEHDAHLYFKRAKSSELLYGSARELRRVVAVRAGLITP